jgi:hypothetical protein
MFISSGPPRNVSFPLQIVAGARSFSVELSKVHKYSQFSTVARVVQGVSHVNGVYHLTLWSLWIQNQWSGISYSMSFR